MVDVRRSRDAILGRCRKHPRHQQSPGVCSLCLSERLSQLQASSSKSRTGPVRSYSSSSSSSSISSYYSSSLESSYLSSPMRRYRRFADEAKSGPLLLSALFGSKGVLRKSRSIAAVPKDVVKRKDEKGKKKLGGFWSRLVRGRRKGREDNGLEHSSNVEERVTT